uniref:Zinc finger CW-type and PWWP domain containing 2 n=1 Tax=Salvator merianae TaxID=96440 RepID=A0A8D0C462_SALMN
MEVHHLDMKTCKIHYMDSTEYDIYLNKVWIQCENSSCLKWRLLSQDDTSCVDPNAPWYCYMNPDPWFNKCSISEEHFPEASQMQKHGLKYVYSKFPLGSLVLVKMHTWPSWPGILCPDPTNGHYMTYDADGDVESYHIEFLGKPHTRIWAPVKSINVCKRKKAWYASALEEAKELLACSVQQRLEMCCLSKKGTIIWPFDCLSILNSLFEVFPCKQDEALLRNIKVHGKPFSSNVNLNDKEIPDLPDSQKAGDVFGKKKGGSKKSLLEVQETASA